MGTPVLCSTALLCLQILLCAVHSSARTVSAPWSSSQYGPDGPWQAVTVKVGGSTETDPTSTVDLYPGGIYASFIMSSKACVNFTNRDCGRGGFWEPSGKGPLTYFRPSWEDKAIGYSGWNDQYVQAMTIANQYIKNTTLVSVSNETVTAPNGLTRGVQVGILSLGPDIFKDDQAQYLAFGNIYPGLVGWYFPGALFNQSITSSESYGLHIGSAAMGYSGSLTFGGYDKGRTIGPAVTWQDQFPTLLDIGIGVETGTSPFSFRNLSGLFVSNTSQQVSAIVQPDPTVPYFHVPGKTCEALASHLPIFFNQTVSYWLWNTTSPLYNSIITSAAYLSFSFPPPAGQSDPVIIKVPFALLNLTLDTPITTKPTPYFPCQAFEPAAVNDSPYSRDFYRLGRAFLQAAFLGRNFRSHTSWLTQAPGPGIGNQGLGQQIVDIQDKDTTISTFTDTSLFAQSWTGHWSPVPQPNDTASTVSTDTGLPTGAKAGIGIGATLGVVAIIGFLVLIIMRRRKRSAAAASDGGPPPPAYEIGANKTPAMAFVEAPVPPSELGNHKQQAHESHELP